MIDKMKRHIIYFFIVAMILCSCSYNSNRYLPVASYEELCVQDSLSGGYLSSVIEVAVDNHVRRYLGFESEQDFFDSTFLSYYPTNVGKFFNTNKDGFTFTLDTENLTVETFFLGKPYLSVDVSRYNSVNLCCLFRNKVLLYDGEGNVLKDDKMVSTVKHEIKKLEHQFIEKGYLCDSILDVDIPYPMSLFCDISSLGNPTFRCFFDTISLPQNNYLKTVVETLHHYCSQYGLSRIVSNFVILYPAR